MKLVSVNTGLPREVSWHGRMVTTGIFKEAVKGRVALRKLNLDGDRQADLTVHGGAYKAVYCYPLAHYDYWKKELPGGSCGWACLERILRLMTAGRDCRRSPFIWAIGFPSARRKWR